MQLRLASALSIFLGSYFPLSLILLAQNFDYTTLSRPLCWRWILGDSQCAIPFSNPQFAIGIFFVCFICFVITIFTLTIVQPKHFIVIDNVKYIPADLMNYVLPYVVSFMSIDYQDTGKFIGFLIFLAWMFWLTFKSGQIILNPLLAAFGWRFYDICYFFPGDNTKHAGIALAHTALEPGKHYKHVLVQDVIIIKST